jgi:hypothetical protein
MGSGNVPLFPFKPMPGNAVPMPGNGSGSGNGNGAIVLLVVEEEEVEGTGGMELEGVRTEEEEDCCAGPANSVRVHAAKSMLKPAALVLCPLLLVGCC